jgi:hypothetical protein
MPSKERAMTNNHPNIEVMCEDHAPRPQERFAALPPSFFRNKWIKLAFVVQDESSPFTHEHMWVEVLDVLDNDALFGRIDNIPICDIGFDCDDTLIFAHTDVEAVFDPQTKATL